MTEPEPERQREHEARSPSAATRQLEVLECLPPEQRAVVADEAERIDERAQATIIGPGSTE